MKRNRIIAQLKGENAPRQQSNQVRSLLFTPSSGHECFKVYEKAGTLRISVQDVKNIHAAKEAMEGVVGVPA